MHLKGNIKEWDSKLLIGKSSSTKSWCQSRIQEPDGTRTYKKFETTVEISKNPGQTARSDDRCRQEYIYFELWYKTEFRCVQTRKRCWNVICGSETRAYNEIVLSHHIAFGGRPNSACIPGFDKSAKVLLIWKSFQWRKPLTFGVLFYFNAFSSDYFFLINLILDKIKIMKKWSRFQKSLLWSI